MTALWSITGATFGLRSSSASGMTASDMIISSLKSSI
jgi:hypothetical protein